MIEFRVIFNGYVKGIRVLSLIVYNVLDIEELRVIGDMARNSIKSGVVVISGVIN